MMTPGYSIQIRFGDEEIEQSVELKHLGNIFEKALQLRQEEVKEIPPSKDSSESGNPKTSQTCKNSIS
ncbi:hypothetical protein QYM36_016117 [Artemia franciscana]|uniref:Uncharacterized protein n=1 Tax=Artemia franciscana TaxID=6661 RepID=A0AA88H6D8_ARTSF|nr:hypothetical protein QYM36_016117 [Artemia franciscana]